MIKGKKPEEIRKEFNIVNDFTPEEEVSEGWRIKGQLISIIINIIIRKKYGGRMPGAKILEECNRIKYILLEKRE